MVNIYKSEEAAQLVQERAVVTLQVPAANRDAANAFDRQLIVAAGNVPAEKGPLSIDTQYDERAAALQVSITSSVAAACRMLDQKSSDGAVLLDHKLPAAATIEVNAMHRPGAIHITNHLLAAAKNNPPEDLPLRIDTGYDPDRLQLQVVPSGSVFAIGYMLFLIYIDLTQTSVCRRV